MPFQFKLELSDGTPAKPATFATAVPTWRVGDSVFIRPELTYRVIAAEDDVAEGIARLRADLESGDWDRRYGHLRALPELDLGHRLLISELA